MDINSEKYFNEENKKTKKQKQNFHKGAETTIPVMLFTS